MADPQGQTPICPRPCLVEIVHDANHLLPVANIARLMKIALPDSAKISREAKELVQELTSDYIGFITCEAAERLIAEKRKTMTGTDSLDAMLQCGFTLYVKYLEGIVHVNKNKSTKYGAQRINHRHSATEELYDDRTPRHPPSISSTSMVLEEASYDVFLV